MADEKRPSARSDAPGANRGSNRTTAAATASDSSRMVPPVSRDVSRTTPATGNRVTGSGRSQPTGSGRSQPQPNKGSTRTTAPAVSTTASTRSTQPSVGSPRTTASGRAAPSSGSQRASANASGRAAPAAPASASSRRRSEAPAGPPKKKPPLPKFEMIIAGGVLGVILVIALVIGYSRNADKREKERIKDAADAIFEQNIKRAEIELPKAINAGTNYVLGNEGQLTPEIEAKLSKPFESNKAIYNVVYNRDYKDRKQVEKQETFAMVKDVDHTKTIIQIGKGTEESSWSIKYALGRENGQWVPIVVAKRQIKPAKEDLVNMGGTITVIVRADDDDTFRKAREKQSPPEVAPGTGTTTPAPTTTPAATTPPAENKVTPPSGEKPAEPKPDTPK